MDFPDAVKPFSRSFPETRLDLMSNKCTKIKYAVKIVISKKYAYFTFAEKYVMTYHTYGTTVAVLLLMEALISWRAHRSPLEPN